MFKFLISICLIIKTHSWTWYDYPSPRENSYACRVYSPAYVCDPDLMLTGQQTREIIQLVEDFKEKTKRPNSSIPCMREGLRLVVALAKDKVGYEDKSSGMTNLCLSALRWTSSDETKCDSYLHGIELNSNGFYYCHLLHWTMTANDEKYQKLNSEQNQQLNKNNHFNVLRDYIIKLQMLYIHRFSIFDNPEVFKEAKISQSKMHQPLQGSQGDITLSQLRADIEENKLKLSEMRDRQSSKNL